MPCRPPRKHACSLSRLSPYCPTPESALSKASFLRALLGVGQQGSLLARKLAFIQVCVEAALLEEAFVVALFNNVAVFHNQDNVCFLNG